MTALKWVAAVAGALCALGLSAALGQGLAPLSRVPAALGAGECTPIPPSGFPCRQLSFCRGAQAGLCAYQKERVADLLARLTRLNCFTAAGALLCLAAWAKARDIAQQFVFVDFSHAHNH